MTLGERIKEHRNRLGFSQEKIAELVNVSRQAVTKWETDQSIPCMENLITLADIFEISLSELSGKARKEVLNLKPVKRSWNMYGIISIRLGSLLLVASTVLLLIQLVTKKTYWNVWVLALGINGVTWLLLGIIFSVCAMWEDKKLTRLKVEGLRYNAKIERIVNGLYWIRMGSIRSGYIECSYQNQDREKCLVKSSHFILEEQSPNYNVTIYVNPDKPMDYAVEVNIITEISKSIKHDYT